jgi:hypothetical protein
MRRKSRSVMLALVVLAGASFGLSRSSGAQQPPDDSECLSGGIGATYCSYTIMGYLTCDVTCGGNTYACCGVPTLTKCQCKPYSS